MKRANAYVLPSIDHRFEDKDALEPRNASRTTVRWSTFCRL